MLQIIFFNETACNGVLVPVCSVNLARLSGINSSLAIEMASSPPSNLVPLANLVCEATFKAYVAGESSCFAEFFTTTCTALQAASDCGSAADELITPLGVSVIAVVCLLTLVCWWYEVKRRPANLAPPASLPIENEGRADETAKFSPGFLENLHRERRARLALPGSEPAVLAQAAGLSRVSEELSDDEKKEESSGAAP